MSSVVIGDYKYEEYAAPPTWTAGAQVEVVDKTKSTYGTIRNPVTIGGRSYSVISMDSCFAGCTSLTEAPTIPNSVTDMSSCFNGCTSLTEAPPVIPNSVTKMYACFAGCTSLAEAPTIPNGVMYMAYCFDQCKQLTQAPEIPSSVLDVEGCFQFCDSLVGNVVVNNTPTSYVDVFRRVENEVFIVNNGSGESVWREVANQSANIHYEADDNPIPVVSSFTALRVDSEGSTTFDATGLYAYVQARLMVYDSVLPVGWESGVKTITLKDNGSTKTAVWQPTITSYPADVHCWINLQDTSSHTIELQIADSIKCDGTEEASHTSTPLSVVISKSYALVDYYHDDTTDTEGMSIGKYAEEADLFDVDMFARFRQGLAGYYVYATTDLECEERLLLWLATIGQSGTIDDDIYNTLVSLGWDGDCLDT